VEFIHDTTKIECQGSNVHPPTGVESHFGQGEHDGLKFRLYLPVQMRGEYTIRSH
jgi:hypothetical protein